MTNSSSAFDADIDYAVRMVRTGCATVEQAARTCGIPLPILQARIDAVGEASAKAAAARPQRTRSVGA